MRIILMKNTSFVRIKYLLLFFFLFSLTSISSLYAQEEFDEGIDFDFDDEEGEHSFYDFQDAEFYESNDGCWTDIAFINLHEDVEDVEDEADKLRQERSGEEQDEEQDEEQGQEQGKPQGIMRGLAGVTDFFTANMFDLDKRGGIFGGGEQQEQEQEQEVDPNDNFVQRQPSFIKTEAQRNAEIEAEQGVDTDDVLNKKIDDLQIDGISPNVSTIEQAKDIDELEQGLETKDEEWKWNEAKWRNDAIRNLLPKHPLSCDQPMLLIDDECDSASIDISKRSNKGPQDLWDEEQQHLFQQTDPSKTNQLIRRILKCFNKSAYIGYTATPLALSLIHI